MKKLLVLLFSFFLLSSPSVFADDISDFQIEGISIGDSLLDYMTEEEILEEIELTKNIYLYKDEPNKYSEVYKFNNLQKYDALSLFVLNNPISEYLTNKNNKYTIQAIRGMMAYIEDFNGCMQERDEIAGVLSKMFPNADKKESRYISPNDPSGKSMKDGITFKLDSGDSIVIHCSDYEETFRIKKNWQEGLNISIRSNEINSWF